MNLNTQQITDGPLTAAALDRKTNPGNIYDLHRAAMESCAACNGSCQKTGACNCFMAAEACTELGAEPVGRSARWWLAFKRWF